jgi:polyisoprenoid-binding protein YceI
VTAFHKSIERRLRRAVGGFLATILVLLDGQMAAHARQPPPPGAVDLAGSRVYVFVGKTGLGHDHAVVGALQAGQVRLGAAEQAGTLVFDMRSFRADTPEARKLLGLPGETDARTRKQVDGNMLGPAVLDVARHPTATFEIRSALPATQQPSNGRTAYDLVGTFTLHGVARLSSIHAEAEAVGAIVRLWGGFSIKQSDFGIKPFAKLGGVVGVADELKIYGDIRVATGGTP